MNTKVMPVRKMAMPLILAALALLLSGWGAWKLAWYLTGDSYHVKKYLKLAEQCHAAGEHGKTQEYCASALELDENLGDAYLWYADACLAQGQYEDALQMLGRGMEAVGGEELFGKMAEAYRGYADACLAQGRYEDAVQALMDGAEATGAAELSEREDWLRDHIVVVKKNYYDFYGDFDGWDEFDYDASGKRTRMVKYLENGVALWWIEYEYDAGGNLTEEVEYLSEERIRSRKEYKYDANGNLTEYVDYDIGGDVRERYEYDANGNPTKYEYYDSDSNGYLWTEYEYDAAGNQVRAVDHDGDGNIYGWSEYEYDVAGNCTQYLRYGADGSAPARKEYEYDADGNQLKSIVYSGDRVFYWIDCEYDAAGNLISYVHYSGSDGAVIGQKEYEYDRNGNQMKLSQSSYSVYGPTYYWLEEEYDVLGQRLSMRESDGYHCSYTYQYRYTGE
ncbi:MAG: tetratricopeptide repeat protein [Blautia sp.]|nr:tetratricopeptide repeat protein [Blautia sp.]